MTNVVAFDIGSTLIHPSMTALASLLQLQPHDSERVEEWRRAFTYALEADQRHLAYDDRDYQQGLTLLRELQMPTDSTVEVAREIWRKVREAGGSTSCLYTDLDPDAHLTLSALRDAGWKIIAASNSDGTLVEELDRFGLTSYFDHVIDSFDLGYEKPKDEFFQHVISLYDDGFARMVYVGNDPLKDVLASLWSGFNRSVLYDPVNAYPGLASRWRIQKLSDLVSLLESIRGD